MLQWWGDNTTHLFCVKGICMKYIYASLLLQNNTRTKIRYFEKSCTPIQLDVPVDRKFIQRSLSVICRPQHVTVRLNCTTCQKTGCVCVQFACTFKWACAISKLLERKKFHYLQSSALTKSDVHHLTRGNNYGSDISRISHSHCRLLRLSHTLTID